MIRTLILFMPAFVCLVWVIILTWMTSRTDSFRPLIFLALFTTVFAFTDGFHSDPHSPEDIEAATKLVMLFFAPSLIPLAFAYVRNLRGRSLNTTMIVIWFIPPVVLVTAGVLLHFLCGPDEVKDFINALGQNRIAAVNAVRGTTLHVYYIFVEIIYRLVLLVQIVWLILVLTIVYWKDRLKLADILRFTFKGGSIRVQDLQVFNLLVLLIVFSLKYLLFKDFINQYPWLMITLALLLAVVVCFFCAVAMLAMKKEVVMKDFMQCFRYDFSTETRSSFAESLIIGHLPDADTDALKRIQERVVDALSFASVQQSLQESGNKEIVAQLKDAEAGSWKDMRLLAGFQKLMLEEKLYLQPGLTVVDVADRLNSNKTYVSRMVNSAYNMTFPELLNKLRVDHAQQYILAHPDARQDRIASACGFVSASSFNNTFKKITGLTPKVWVAGALRSEKSFANR